MVEADKEVATARLRKQNRSIGEQRKKEEYNADLIEKWKEKVLHGRYPAELEDCKVDRKVSVMWLTDGYLY